MPTNDDILAALRTVKEPELHKDLVTLNMVRNLTVQGGAVRFTIMLTTPACPLKDQILAESRAAVSTVPGVSTVEIQFSAEVKGKQMADDKVLPEGVRNIIAVASGKGGVGKSTTSVNLAIALKKSGARVGIMDADVYGPNIPMMMGIPDTARPQVTADQRMIPLESHGVKIISMGFLVAPGKPLIWRGPMLNSVVEQFLKSTLWGDLDYLVVDLPPGTGDASLSLVQTVPLSGAIIVTTPQEVALSDVRRSIGMFNQVRVPILGIIENMSGLDCPSCQHHIPLYPGDGGRSLAQEFDIPLLVKVPFDPLVGQGGDQGLPISLSKPASAQAKAFYQAAEWVAARVSVLNSEIDRPTIQVG
jgi:ATP-binding protein involved in chromosome partitioning